MLGKAFLKTLRYTAFISFPAAIGMSLYGPALVSDFYGPRWQALVDPLRVLCLYGLFRSLSSIVLDAIKGTGNPHLMRRVVIVKLLCVGGLGVPALNMYGIMGICWLVFATYVLSFLLELRALCRVLDLEMVSTLKELALPATLSVILVPVIYWSLTWLVRTPNVISLVMGIVVTALAYVGALSLCDKRAVADVRSLVISKAAA